MAQMDSHVEGSLQLTEDSAALSTLLLHGYLVFNRSKFCGTCLGGCNRILMQLGRRLSPYNPHLSPRWSL